jgi:hypothetical protein
MGQNESAMDTSSEVITEQSQQVDSHPSHATNVANGTSFSALPASVPTPAILPSNTLHATFLPPTPIAAIPTAQPALIPAAAVPMIDVQPATTVQSRAAIHQPLPAKVLSARGVPTRATVASVAYAKPNTMEFMSSLLAREEATANEHQQHVARLRQQVKMIEQTIRQHEKEGWTMRQSSPDQQSYHASSFDAQHASKKLRMNEEGDYVTATTNTSDASSPNDSSMGVPEWTSNTVQSPQFPLQFPQTPNSPAIFTSFPLTPALSTPDHPTPFSPNESVYAGDSFQSFREAHHEHQPRTIDEGKEFDPDLLFASSSEPAAVDASNACEDIQTTESRSNPNPTPIQCMSTGMQHTQLMNILNLCPSVSASSREGLLEPESLRAYVNKFTQNGATIGGETSQQAGIISAGQSEQHFDYAHSTAPLPMPNGMLNRAVQSIVGNLASTVHPQESEPNGYCLRKLIGDPTAPSAVASSYHTTHFERPYSTVASTPDPTISRMSKAFLSNFLDSDVLKRLDQARLTGLVTPAELTRALRTITSILEEEDQQLLLEQFKKITIKSQEEHGHEADAASLEFIESASGKTTFGPFRERIDVSPLEPAEDDIDGVARLRLTMTICPPQSSLEATAATLNATNNPSSSSHPTASSGSKRKAEDDSLPQAQRPTVQGVAPLGIGFSSSHGALIEYSRTGGSIPIGLGPSIW